MDLFIIISQRFCPTGRQMLRHDVLYGIIAFVTMTIDIFILQSPKVFKSLKNVQFVFTVHQIDLSIREGIHELRIIREPATLCFGQQSILEFLNIIIGSSIITDDLSMEHKKDFVQSIRGKITDRPAEQEILRMQEDITNILDAELAFILQSQHLQEERTSNRRLQAIKTLDASFELFFFFRFRFAVASAFQQDLIPLCICQQILQKWLCFAFLVINICLEGNILTHFQLSGMSKGISSSVTSGRDLSFFSLPERIRDCFSV